MQKRLLRNFLAQVNPNTPISFKKTKGYASKHSLLRYPLKKTKGYAGFLFGAFVLAFTFLLMMLTVKKMEIDRSLEAVENALTTSALGGLNWDFRAVALSGEVVVPISSENEPYVTVCNLVGKNLKLKQVGANKYRAEREGFIANTSDCVLEKFILYNVHKDNTTDIYEFGADGTRIVRTETEAVRNPQGEIVDSTSIYIEFTFPIEFNGKEKVIRKGEYVSLAESTY